MSGDGHSRDLGVAVGSAATAAPAAAHPAHAAHAGHAADQEPAMCFDRATLAYGDRVVWSELSMTVPPGEFLAVLGPNGSASPRWRAARSTSLAARRAVATQRSGTSRSTPGSTATCRSAAATS